jgi:hypothetical protein
MSDVEACPQPEDVGVGWEPPVGVGTDRDGLPVLSGFDLDDRLGIDEVDAEPADGRPARPSTPVGPVRRSAAW